jgi:hypothetical protein
MGKVFVRLNKEQTGGTYGREGCFGGWSQYAYKYGDGYFTWFHCREEFHEDCPNLGVFLYWTTPDKQRKVIAYIRRAENMLGLKDEERCVISHTNYKNILHVQVGSFWKRPLRLSLLTIMFRDGRQYDPRRRNFWETAKKSVYLGEPDGCEGCTAMYAFRKFMAGHVNFNYHKIKGDNRNQDYYEDYYGWDYDLENGFKLNLSQGWMSNFGYIREETVDKLLLKPRGRNANRKRDRRRR